MANLPSELSEIIPNLNKNLATANSDFAGELRRVIDLRSENYIKQAKKIVLREAVAIPIGDSSLATSTAQNAQIVNDIDDVELGFSNPYAFRFLFLNLTDNLINTLKVSIYAYGTGNYSDIDTAVMSRFRTAHIWEKIDDSNYMLHVHVSTTTSSPTYNFSEYLFDVSVTFFNSAIRKVML